MNLNIFNCKLDSSNFILDNCFCSCMSKGSLDVNEIVLLKLPDGTDPLKVFDQLIHDSNFSLVLSLDKQIISVDYKDKFSVLLNTDISKIKGKTIKDLEKIKKINIPVLRVFEEMVDASIKNKNFNGILFDKKNHFQYLLCSFPVMDNHNLYGIYVSKSRYNEGFFGSNLF